jgi:hypothetical protein
VAAFVLTGSTEPMCDDCLLGFFFSPGRFAWCAGGSGVWLGLKRRGARVSPTISTAFSSSFHTDDLPRTATGSNDTIPERLHSPKEPGERVKNGIRLFLGLSLCHGRDRSGLRRQ